MNYLRGNCMKEDNEYSYLYVYGLIICWYIVYIYDKKKDIKKI